MFWSGLTFTLTVVCADVSSAEIGRHRRKLLDAARRVARRRQVLRGGLGVETRKVSNFGLAT